MNEFQVHRLNETGLARADSIAEIFACMLAKLDEIGLPPGRARSLVVTKLQESCFWAKRSIAELPENQVTP